MNWRRFGLAAALAALWAPALPGQIPGKVDFARDIQPLFRTYCYACHGPVLVNGGLRLDRRRDVMPNRVGANGARIVPGNTGASRLYLRVSGTRAGLQMPPTGALSKEEIELIKAWIDQGADWPDALAGEAPSPPQDPGASQLMDALHRGDEARFARLLRENPKSARGKGRGGSTPLMYAALYGDARSVRLLLANHAEPNSRNDAGATALLWAVDDPEKTRLLLARGADANARSEDGVTPVLLASGRYGSADVLKLLLDGGARLEGPTILSRAAAAGDEAVMRLLIDRGVDHRTLPRDLALRSGCWRCFELLLPFTSHEDLNRAAAVAGQFGDSKSIRMLLDHGAVSEGGSNSPGPATQPDAVLAQTPVLPARAAVEKSLPLLQHADTVFLQRAGCISCHNNSLFQMSSAAARQKGFAIDEQAAQSQLQTMAAYLESWRERVLQDIPIPGGVDTIGYIMAGLAAANYPADEATDALARYLLRRQLADGGWRIATQRPPIESSDFEATAVALRGIQVYAPQPQRAAYRTAVQRGVIWLGEGQPVTNEDHVFRLLGLGWAGAGKGAIQKAAQDLLARQKPDGGWAQLPTMASDAYATGQALTALASTGGVAVTASAYQAGVQFLLKRQLADGSWHAKSRARPVQPYFDSEFPHDRDQFLSAAATNWAVMALVSAAP